VLTKLENSKFNQGESWPNKRRSVPLFDFCERNELTDVLKRVTAQGKYRSVGHENEFTRVFHSAKE